MEEPLFELEMKIKCSGGNQSFCMGIRFNDLSTALQLQRANFSKPFLTSAFFLQKSQDFYKLPA